MFVGAREVSARPQQNLRSKPEQSSLFFRKPASLLGFRRARNGERLFAEDEADVEDALRNLQVFRAPSDGSVVAHLVLPPADLGEYAEFIVEMDGAAEDHADVPTDAEPL